MTNLSLNRFLDTANRLQQWPTKHTDKNLVLTYLADKFSPGAIYTESQVNDILKAWHTFGDWPLLRRELYESRFLNRETDGSKYWRTDKPGYQAIQETSL